MAVVGTYLNFPRNCEEAFNFYKSVFGGEFAGNGIMRMGTVPAEPGQPSMAEEDKNLVMHVTLPIMGNHMLMGSDAPESMCPPTVFGNNSFVCLTPDTRKECDSLFNALSVGGVMTIPLADMFWGDYFGTVTDKFGVQWMINFNEKYV